ncbi:MAG TPA: nucleotide exchange factor GrpE [Acetobacteraceae bacterium]|nr:nucleotide exchange factor GrpE [Acetobacteraceae bacterium]
MNTETEHDMMQDTPRPPPGEPGQAAEGDATPKDVSNQNTPVSQDALMNAATARIAELEAEVAELKDRWMRSEAEIANVRARSRREVDETRQYAVQKFATDVVEAADNLRRGIDSLPAPAPGQPEIVAKLREGFEGVERGVLAILERNGIRREDPTGQPFDPKLHQAMGEQESEAHAPGTVIHAWSPAWTLNGRLLRPAMVVVAKAPPAELAAAGAGAKLDTTA